MSRENRMKVLGVALGLFGLLAPSGPAAAWELSLDGWYAQGEAVGQFWQLAWSGVQSIWGATSLGSDPNYAGEPGPAPLDSGTQCVSGDCAEHSAGIDPNG